MATAMSVGAPTPWPPPPPTTPSSDTAATKTFRDCQPGICTLNCRQYCNYFFLQPPPQEQSSQGLPYLNNSDGTTADDDSSSSHSISPLMAALIAVLAAAFLLLFYYTVVSRLCRRRRNTHNRRRILRSLGSSSSASNPRADAFVHDPARPDTGLDDAFIRQITVFRYKSGDGLVESTECAVCLSEFSDGESLRLMPNCEHAFHIPCIDTWLQSHSNCPLCRSTMNPLPLRSGETEVASGGGGVTVAAMRVERGNNDVLVVREVENRGEVQVEVVVEAVATATNEERVEERDRKLDDNNGRSR